MSDLSKRRLIGGPEDDIMRISPVKYKWAWDYYMRANANHWLPNEIDMQKDIQQWNTPGVLTDNEKHIVKTALGFFTTADSLVANNLVLKIYKQVTAPEVRMYLLRQAYEEAIHCYKRGTDILTENGFIPFEDLGNERVAQYHMDGSISFTHIDEKICDEFEGNLISFQNYGTYHSVVTPNHRCVTFNERGGGSLEITMAEKLSPCNRRFPVSGVLKGTRSLTDFERLQIAYQADGDLLNKGFKNGDVTDNIGYLFSFKKERKIVRIRELLIRLAVDYTETVIGSGFTNFYIRVPKETPLSKDFNWFSLSEISGKWAEEFIEELQYWDGPTRPKGIVYTTTNQFNANQVVLLSHLCGKRADLYPAPETENRKESYQVHISEKSYVIGKTIEKTEEYYKGKVYCVGVPTGMIVVRYNGKIAVSGNTHSYQHIVESLALDEDEIFESYRTVQSIYDKDAFVTQLAESTGLNAIIGFYLIMEGIFFYSSFAAIMAIKRRNLLPGTCKQFEYIMRDESMHLNFGIELINGIFGENPPGSYDVGTVKSAVEAAVNLENEYATRLVGKGMLGLSVESFHQYVQYIADRRLEAVYQNPIYKVKNPFPWMSEITDLPKYGNFFETRVTDYAIGQQLNWEE